MLHLQSITHFVNCFYHILKIQLLPKLIDMYIHSPGIPHIIYSLGKFQ